MLVTLVGIVIDGNLEQSENERPPIDVQVVGIVIVDRFESL